MKVFIDTNVFVFGLLFPETNSRIVLDKAESKEFEVYISELVLEELRRFFRENYGDQEAYNAVKYAESLSSVIPMKDIKSYARKYRGKIKDKDLDNLATARFKKVDYLISYDRDYKNFKEHITPKEFVKKLDLKGFGIEY